MADITEKDVVAASHPASSSADPEIEAGDTAIVSTVPPLPTGWMYKRISLGFWKGTYYASPLTQVILVSLVCFLDPGMNNALSGLGGGGQLNATVANNATVASYATFAFFAFFAGSICNLIGVRWMLVIGGSGYALSCASYICYNHTGNEGFVIFGGAFAGFCAGLLWTAQGTVTMSYPPEEKKGKYISIGWAIFNLGSVLGSLIPLGESVNGSGGSSVGDDTYIAFTVLMFLGSAVGLSLIRTSDVVREDGSRVIIMKHPSWKSEFIGLYKVLRTDYFIILLFPMFFSSNWFYTYQFNDFNLARFNTRTRALNNLVYWTMQILGAFCFGFFLDWKRFSRPMRARIAWGVLFVMTLAIWGAALKYQIGFTRDDVAATSDGRIDWTGTNASSSSEWGRLFVLYIFWGFFDAAWQTTVYWFMGSLSNNARKLALYAGFYKSIQSTGNAIVWRLDALETSYMTMLGVAWGLLLGGLVFALPVIWFKIKDHTQLDSDLVFSDEVEADVKATTD